MSPADQTTAPPPPDEGASQGPGTKNAEREALLQTRKEQGEFISSYLTFRDLLQNEIGRFFASRSGMDPDDEKVDMQAFDWMKANEERVASLFMSYRKDKRDAPRAPTLSPGYAPRGSAPRASSGAPPASGRPASDKQLDYIRKLIQQGHIKESDVLNLTRSETMEAAASMLTSAQASELINAGIRASGREPSPPPQRGQGAPRKW